MANKRFENKVIWITGASSGIGEHLAYQLSNEGAKLVISARRAAELERVKTKCNTETLILPLDITAENTFEDAVNQVVQKFGKIDILVNNAGVSQRSFARDTHHDVDKRIMHINFFGTVALTKKVLPIMEKQGYGHVVIVSSVTGKFGTPQRSAYAASKHALHGYFDSVRAEMADTGIKFTMVCPGFVKTNLTYAALTADGSPLDKMGDGTKNGMLPDIFAKKMANAIYRKKSEVYIGGFREVLAVYLKRFAPGILEKIIARAKVT